MLARGRNSFGRIFCGTAVIVTAFLVVELLVFEILGLATAAVAGDAFENAFPAPQWQRAKSATKLAAECVSKTCGRGAHAFYALGPANPTIAENIKAGAFDRDWAEKLAVSFRKSQGDKITVLDFSVQSGETPGWLMVYECNCDGKTNYISSQIMAAEKGSMTFFSSARTPAASLENMNKMVAVVLGAAGR